MKALNKLFENKTAVIIIVVMSLLVFLTGFSAVTSTAIEQARIVKECNEHWQNQIEQKYGIETTFIEDLPKQFNLSAG